MSTSTNALSAAGPASRLLYKELLAALQSIGPFQVEVKKTSIHLVRRSAFAGLHPRKQYLLLTIKAAKPIRSRRILKAEQVSKNRWHLDVKLAAAEQIDEQLLDWLQQAYGLCA